MTTGAAYIDYRHPVESGEAIMNGVNGRGNSESKRFTGVGEMMLKVLWERSPQRERNGLIACG